MNFKKITALLMAGTLALSVTAGCKKKDESKTAGDTVKVGFMGALTGDVAMFGKPTLEGMKMAANVINAAVGINGKKIEIVEADSRFAHKAKVPVKMD